MGEVYTFLPRRRRSAAGGRSLRDGSALRAEVEQAAEHAIDTAERLIAILDAMDGNPDDEEGGDTEPSLAAPEHRESQVVWLRGTDRDLEIDHTPEMDS